MYQKKLKLKINGQFQSSHLTKDKKHAPDDTNFSHLTRPG